MAEAVRGPLEAAERGEASGGRGRVGLLERRVPLAERVGRVDRVGERAAARVAVVDAVLGSLTIGSPSVVGVVAAAHEVQAVGAAGGVVGRAGVEPGQPSE